MRHVQFIWWWNTPCWPHIHNWGRDSHALGKILDYSVQFGFVEIRVWQKEVKP